jgi:hypothetical protein
MLETEMLLFWVELSRLIQWDLVPSKSKFVGSAFTGWITCSPRRYWTRRSRHKCRPWHGVRRGQQCDRARRQFVEINLEVVGFHRWNIPLFYSRLTKEGQGTDLPRCPDFLVISLEPVPLSEVGFYVEVRFGYGIQSTDLLIPLSDD